jgi:casein kinase I family protein HRR25
MDQISRIDYIQSRNFIHRTIKPDDFLMGFGKRGNQVNVVDFGLAKMYRDPKTYLHITTPDGGTTRGRPVGATTVTRSVSLARHDDLESLVYVPMYLLCGALPWQGLKAATK